MFKEKEITAAFEKLFGLFDKEKLCGEDEVPFHKRICLADVAMILRDRVTTPMSTRWIPAWSMASSIAELSCLVSVPAKLSPIWILGYLT